MSKISSVRKTITSVIGKMEGKTTRAAGDNVVPFPKKPAVRKKTRKTKKLTVALKPSSDGFFTDSKGVRYRKWQNPITGERFMIRGDGAQFKLLKTGKWQIVPHKARKRGR